MTTFRADTPPGPDDGSVLGVASAAEVDAVNRGVMADAGNAGLAAVVGNSAQLADAERAMRQKVTDAQNAVRAARVAAGGGDEVSSALSGTIGDQVAEAIRIDQVDAMFKRISNSIRDERDAVGKSFGPGPAAAHLSELVDQAITAAETKKGPIPSISTAHRIWLNDLRIASEGRVGDMALTEVGRRHIEAKRQRVIDRLPEVDVIVVEFAAGVLERARAAHEVLGSAGLSVDSTADDVIAAMDIDAQKSWYSWREAVADWSDVQSARRWVAEQVRGRGPTQAKGAYALTADPGVDVAASVWRSQFIGADLPTWVEGSHQALRWWCSEGSAYAARGVLSDDDQFNHESEVDA